MLGEAQEHLALSASDAGGGVRQPVAQGLGLSAVQLALIGQQRRLGQRDQVGSDQRQLDPDGVDRLLPGRQVAQPGVLAGADAVLDPGVRAMAGFQERGVPTGVELGLAAAEASRAYVELPLLSLKDRFTRRPRSAAEGPDKVAGSEQPTPQS